MSSHRQLLYIFFFFFFSVSVDGSNFYPKSPRDVAAQSLRAGASFTASLLLSSLPVSAAAVAAKRSTQQELSLEDVAERILRECTQTVSACRNTGQCLYRGTNFSQTSAFAVKGGFDLEKLDTSPFENGVFSGTTTSGNSFEARKPSLDNPKPDLLDSATYISPVASDYFKALDDAVVELSNEDGEFRVRPSVGHIATSDVSRASQWGEVISIWPLDKLSYAVLKFEKEWWNDEWCTLQGKRGPMFWRNPDKLSNFLKTEIIFDKGLEGALSSGSEVLFTSVSPLGAFYTVPLYMVPKLLRLLEIEPFSNKVVIKKSSGGMILEGGEVKRSRILDLL